MIIYTDDKKYAAKILPDVKSWEVLDPEKISIENDFINKILPSKNVYVSKAENDLNWQYLFITKHSDQSQFDLLYNLSKNYAKLPDGILCIADSGSKFHGYRNRKWNAESGNLHLSIYKKPNISIPEFHVGFLMVAAVSVIQTIDLIPDLKEKSWIKWVNDVFINDSKVCGVITRSHTIGNIISGAMFGIGLNIEKSPFLYPESFIKKATYLNKYIENKKVYDIHFVFKKFISIFYKNYNLLLQNGPNNLFNYYCSRCKLLGESIEIYSDPKEGKSKLIAKGKVVNIGKNLELYIDNQKNPIANGRLIYS